MLPALKLMGLSLLGQPFRCSAWEGRCISAPDIALRKKQSNFSIHPHLIIDLLSMVALLFYGSTKGNAYEDIPSTPIPTDDGDIFEGYFLEGFDLAEIE